MILGGGLTGISTALHLRRKWTLFERNSRLGGHARTDVQDGFYFDKTGHWLHLRDPQIKQLIDQILGAEMVDVQRKARVFANGVLTRYPFQANLFGQPKKVIEECLEGFENAWQQLHPGKEPEVRNFEEFIVKVFGSGIANHFMIPYNHKLWGVPPSEITAEWCTRFVPRPKLEEVRAGALSDATSEHGYNISFRYPKRGGIETMTNALVTAIPEQWGQVCLNAAPEWIDLKRRAVGIGGEEKPFEALVSTIPLPVLVGLIREVPHDVCVASERLRCTPVRYFNVATKKPVPADFHWIYVPEKQYPFYRVGIYTNAVPKMAPEGLGSLYVELSERGPEPKGKQLVQLKKDVAKGLVAIGAIAHEDDILFADLKTLEYAYVVFDHNYYADTKLIRSFLQSNGIYPIGRYGSWTYNSMEDCILAGREVAGRLNSR